MSGRFYVFVSPVCPDCGETELLVTGSDMAQCQNCLVNVPIGGRAEDLLRDILAHDIDREGEALGVDLGERVRAIVRREETQS